MATGVATRNYRYMVWPDSGEFELYDMSTDSYQLQNVAGKPEYAKVQGELAAALAVLEDCVGDSCAWTGHFSKPPR